MNKIANNEARLDRYCFDLLFNNYIFEAAGHPLFSDDTEIGVDFIKRLNNLVDYVNAKFENSKIDFRGTLRNYTSNNVYRVDVYKPIIVALNKLGFKDVINAKNFPVKITVANIVEDNVTPNDMDALKYGGDGFYVYSKADQVNKKRQFIVGGDHNGGKIEITCYAINGKLIASSFLETFLHEYLHFYIAYNRTMNNTHRKDIDENNRISVEFKNLIDRQPLKENDKMALKLLTYRLFAGEDNALIGNLLGYLVANKINTYADYMEHKQELLNHTYYTKMKECYEIAKDIPSLVFKILMMNSPAFNKGKKFDDSGKSYDYYHNADNKSSNALKKRFLRMCEDKINKVYSKIIKLVGRYLQLIDNYDKQLVNTVIKY